MTYFCPVCWKEVSAEASACPYCSADLVQTDSRSFVEKLLSALYHPEPQTAVRVAWILGEKREAAAVPELIHVLERTTDGFLAEAAAEALGKIGDRRALGSLSKAAERGPVRVRITARKAIETIQKVER